MLIIISKLQLSGEIAKKHALVLVCFLVGKIQTHCQSSFCVVCGQSQCFKRHLNEETSHIYCLLVATTIAVAQETTQKRQHLTQPLSLLRTPKCSRKYSTQKAHKRQRVVETRFLFTRPVNFLEEITGAKLSLSTGEQQQNWSQNIEK